MLKCLALILQQTCTLQDRYLDQAHRKACFAPLSTGKALLSAFMQSKDICTKQQKNYWPAE